MVARFSHNEEGYVAWLEEHPDGFVFKHFGGRAERYNIVHRARCGYLRRPGDSGSRTVYEKFAATDLQELVSRVNQVQAPGTWKFCNVCNPD